jgi:PAS domain S-box-containing protein
MSTLFPAPAPLGQTRHSELHRYATALFAVALALAVRWFLDPVLQDREPYTFLLVAIGFTAWYAGVLPALLGTLLGEVAATYLFVSPQPTLALSSPTMWTAVAHAAVAVGLIMVLGLSRKRLNESSAALAGLQIRTNEAVSEQSNLRISLDRSERIGRQLEKERDGLDRQLRSGEERMRLAQAIAGFSLFEWEHPDGRLKMVGQDATLDLAGRDWDGLLARVHPEDRARVEKAIARSLASKHSIDLECRVNRADGAYRWIAAKGTTTYDASGHPLRTIGILQDVTEKKSTEEVLLRTEKLAAAGRLAASIAHEINNPLAALTNLLFIVKDDASLSRAGRQYVSMAEEELRRLSHIAKQTLGFYKEAAQPETFELPALLDEVLDLYLRNMPAGIKVEKHYGESVPTQAIRGELQQVFSNLISNAIDALGEQGALRVVVEPSRVPQRPGMLVSIANDGPGIPPEHRKRLFEPFFTTKPGVGTGLGLWLAKQLIEKHGGSIEIESSVDGANRGTQFVVFVPAVAAAPATRSLNASGTA